MIFQQATRAKLRFSTNKGQLSVEDAWDLSLESLDTLAQAVNKQIQESKGESFIGKRSTQSTELQLKMDILLAIIAVKLAEKEDAKNRKELLAKKELLTSLKEKKQMEQLESMSLEDIEKQLQGL